MKNINILIGLFLASITLTNAQIYNNDFENLNPDSSLKNWGNVYITSVWFDVNTGNFYQDSIVYDNKYYAPTTDAHNGNYAMELRNAFNYTSSKGIAGSASPDSNDVFTAWGSTTALPLNYPSSELNFYYKYFPVNNDTAVAKLSVYDNIIGEIGNAEVLITGTKSTYTLSSTPISYSAVGNADYYSLNFSTFYSSSPGSHEPSFGTRFLIDDVSFSTATKIKTNNQEINVNVSPNPAGKTISINTNEKIIELEIYDITGKNSYINFNNLKNIDISSLPSGLYFIEISLVNKKIVKKLIKQ